MFAILYYTPAIDWRLVRSLAAALLCVVCVAMVFMLVPIVLSALAFIMPVLLKLAAGFILTAAFAWWTKP